MIACAIFLRHQGMTKTALLAISSLALSALSSKAAITELDFGGQGWINQNKNWVVSSGTGYTISAISYWSGEATFTCSSSTDWWEVDFAAPEGQSLQVGAYDNAIRYPFNEGAQSGMDIYGDGRGSNQVSASFQVLEISWNPDGTLASFAADFTHLSEGNPNWFTIGQMRYNSTVPIPETSVLTFGLIALPGLVRRKR